MALKQSIQIRRNQYIPTSRDGVGLVAIVAEYKVESALAVNDVIEMMGLPTAHHVVDFFVDFPDLDSNGTPLMSFDAGVVSGRYADKNDARTCGNELFAANTVARTAGRARTDATKNLAAILPSDEERGIGLKVAAAAATAAVGGTIRATLLCMPALSDMVYAA